MAKLTTTDTMENRSAAAGFVLLLSCKNVPGIVAAVSDHLWQSNFNIAEGQQFDDTSSGYLFMRLRFDPVGDFAPSLQQVQDSFEPVARQFEMNWTLQESEHRERVLIMVSKFGHCLNDLLYRTAIGALNIDIAGVVSNHTDLESHARHYQVPFHHIPVSKDTKPEAEARLLELVEQENVDLVVLARYMQILSPDLSARLSGHTINIHHSMLPSFKGAQPYRQAKERGVKMVGATAHYVTDDLDEGPIIEQEIARIDHRMSTAEITALGRDAECQALARAVKWHTEDRVVINGQGTVVFG